MTATTKQEVQLFLPTPPSSSHLFFPSAEAQKAEHCVPVVVTDHLKRVATLAYMRPTLATTAKKLFHSHSYLSRKLMGSKHKRCEKTGECGHKEGVEGLRGCSHEDCFSNDFFTTPDYTNNTFSEGTDTRPTSPCSFPSNPQFDASTITVESSASPTEEKSAAVDAFELSFLLCQLPDKEGGRWRWMRGAKKGTLAGERWIERVDREGWLGWEGQWAKRRGERLARLRRGEPLYGEIEGLKGGVEVEALGEL